MYRDMPTSHVWPNCQSQEFDGDNFHRCEVGPPPGHVFHKCECGHMWDDTELELGSRDA